MLPRLFIDPPSHHFHQDRLFSNERARYGGENLMAPYVHLRDYLQQRGIEVHTADYLPEQPGDQLNLYVSMGTFRDYKKLAHRSDVLLSSFFIFESPIVEPSIYRKVTKFQDYFRRIYTWSDSDSLLHFTGKPLRCLPFHWPQSFEQVHEQIWSQRSANCLLLPGFDRETQQPMTGTNARQSLVDFREGRIDESRFLEIERNCCSGPGTCMQMASANTMCCLIEILGLSLPGCATSHAVDGRKKQIAFESGRQIMWLLRNGILPSHIVTQASSEQCG